MESAGERQPPKRKRAGFHPLVAQNGKTFLARFTSFYSLVLSCELELVPVEEPLRGTNVSHIVSDDVDGSVVPEPIEPTSMSPPWLAELPFTIISGALQTFESL